MKESSSESKVDTERAIPIYEIGEAAMASIGGDYTNYPAPDEHGIRVPIPGHPEIVAYKMPGTPYRDGTIDDLIELDKSLKRLKL